MQPTTGHFGRDEQFGTVLLLNGQFNTQLIAFALAIARGTITTVIVRGVNVSETRLEGWMQKKKTQQASVGKFLGVLVSCL